MSQLDTALIGLFLLSASWGIWQVGRLQRRTAPSRKPPGLRRLSAAPQAASARSITEIGEISSAAAACFLAAIGSVFALLSVVSLLAG
jgi:hypothetical protein